MLYATVFLFRVEKFIFMLYNNLKLIFAGDVFMHFRLERVNPAEALKSIE